MSEAFLVLPDDYGIRPAGKPDACFYCSATVGAPHKEDCAVLVRSSTYALTEVLPVAESDEYGPSLGTWTRDDPATWDERHCSFHKNDFSWCANNLLKEGTLNVSDEVRARLTAIVDDGSSCLCGVVEFRLLERGTQVRRAS